MSMNSKRTFIALALGALASSGAMAISLGDLTVESKPGEPLNAVLEINDVDFTVSPLLVRVAPRTTYQAQGMPWPDSVEGLRIARDTASSGIRVRVIGELGVAEDFPLLIELNAGGVVSVREYVISAKDGRLEAQAAAERTSVSMVRASPQIAAGDDAKAKPAEEKAAPAKPRGRYAPAVVKEYVDLNGFSADEPFKIERDMTLWSIAKLYWPSYEGTTLEQLAQAFIDKNPNAFQDGFVQKLVVGETLNPPAESDVFAVDAETSFKAMHDERTAIPLSTKNLIDAQSVSVDCAKKVAQAQNAERSRAGNAQSIAEAGRRVFEEYKAKLIEERTLMGDPKAGEPLSMRGGELTPRPTVETLGKDAREAKPAQGTSESAAEPVAKSALEAKTKSLSAEEKAIEGKTAEEKSAAETSARPEKEPSVEEPAAEEKPAESPDATASQPVGETSAAKVPEQSTEKDSFPIGWAAIAVLVAAILGFIARMCRRPEGDAEEKKDGLKESTIRFQKDVPATSAAQLKAVDATVAEAVKNGTTAGAMGVGAMAYTAAQMEDEVPADQPWLDPEDDELPPLDEDEVGCAANVTQTVDITNAVKDIDLDLDEETEEAVPEADNLPPIQTPLRYVAPLEPEPIDTPQEGPLQTEPTGEKIEKVANEAASEAVRKPTEREKAQWQAFDAKLKLASSFIGLGAIKEALELLEEVRRHGSADQQERARFLELRIQDKS